MNKLTIAVLCLLTVLAGSAEAKTKKAKKTSTDSMWSSALHARRHKGGDTRLAKLRKGEHYRSSRSSGGHDSFHVKWIPTKGPKAKLTPGAPVGGADRFRF